MQIFNLNNILGALINSLAYILIWSKLSQNKINLKNYKFYLIYGLFAIGLLINYLFVGELLKLAILLILMTILCHFLFDTSWYKSFLCSISSQALIMIAETIYVILVVGIFKVDLNEFLKYFVGKLISNFVISALAVIIGNFKFVSILFKKVNKILDHSNKKVIFMIITVLLLSINFIFVVIYYRYSFIYVFIINIFISLVYLCFSIHVILTEIKIKKINEKYNTTLNSLKEYEEILDKYHVSNHENKNQLLTIRSMIVKKEKNIDKYIDIIINNKIKDDEKLMFDTNKIPAGGLRAVIYSKMLIMKENQIDFKLEVDRAVRTVELIQLGENLMLDVCHVAGVFLDNAIEESMVINDKFILIKLFTDEDNLYMEISNKFGGTINLDKIYDNGYTTKEKGHGYGLPLVKKIVSKNEKLSQSTNLYKNLFTQTLTIKIK